MLVEQASLIVEVVPNVYKLDFKFTTESNCLDVTEIYVVCYDSDKIT